MPGIDSDESDYFGALYRSLSECADSIKAPLFLAAHGREGTIRNFILRQTMPRRGSDATFVTGEGAISPQFTASAGEAAQGTLMTAALPRDSYDRPLDEALEATGLEGGRAAIMSFVALRLLEEARDHVSALDAQAFAQYLRSGAMLMTEIGPVAFDAQGDASLGEYGLFAWRRMPGGLIDYADNLVAR